MGSRKRRAGGKEGCAGRRMKKKEGRRSSRTGSVAWRRKVAGGVAGGRDDGERFLGQKILQRDLD